MIPRISASRGSLGVNPCRTASASLSIILVYTISTFACCRERKQSVTCKRTAAEAMIG